MDERSREMDIFNVIKSVPFLSHALSTERAAEHDGQAWQLFFRYIIFKRKVPVFVPFIARSCKRKAEIRQRKC